MRKLVNVDYDGNPSNVNRLLNMIYPYDDIKKGLGYHQLEIYVPIKLKGEK